MLFFAVSSKKRPFQLRLLLPLFVTFPFLQALSLTSDHSAALIYPAISGTMRSVASAACTRRSNQDQGRS